MTEIPSNTVADNLAEENLKLKQNISEIKKEKD